MKPTVLDGGYEIALANWPNNKHVIHNDNSNIPIQNSKPSLCFG